MSEIDPAKARFFGHPTGLGYLCFTEAWERFSFSGMQTLLVIYMVNVLFKPDHMKTIFGIHRLQRLLTPLYGPLTTTSLASVIFGLYTGFVFLAPLAGGLLGDRFFRRAHLIVSGAGLMAVGNLLMMATPMFFIALSILVIGAGLIKGNISVQVANLYSLHDRRRDNAFQIFSVGIDTGVIAAPLICGSVAAIYGWKYGFLTASLGMVIGLGIYLSGLSHLGTSDRASDTPRDRLVASVPMISSLACVFVLTTIFLSSAGQLGNVYNLWLQTRIDRQAFGYQIPLPWFQSLTPFFSVVIMPLLLKFWEFQSHRNREPAPITKMCIGLSCTALAYTFLALLASLSSGTVFWGWLVPVHAFIALGFLHTWPTGLAIFSRSAPEGYRAMFISLFFTSSFIAGLLIGRIGIFFSSLPDHQFWLLQASIAAGGTILACAMRLVWRNITHKSHPLSLDLV